MSRVRRGLRQRHLLVALALAVLGLALSPGAGAATLGKTTVGASDGGGLVANVKRVNAYQLSVPALVSKLEIYLSPSGVSGTQIMEGVIYSDAGGSPRALLAQSQQISFSSTSHAGWYDLPMATTVTLNPGKYWLGIYTGGTAAVASYRYDSSGSRRARVASNQTYTAGRASNPFGAVGFTDRYLMSLYATYTTPAWTLQSVPAPRSTLSGGQLTGVACTSSSSCIAVGNLGSADTGPTSPATILAERRNGNTWSVLSTPNPSGSPRSVLSADACASSSMCMAVGFAGNASTSTTGWVGGLAERWNGSSWSIQAVPNPPGSVDTGLGSVSCRSTTSCIAVGTYYKAAAGGGVQPLPLTERWNGTSWSIQPQPAGLGGYLNGVSCSSTTACTAVGTSDVTTPDGFGYALIEHWNGITWSAHTNQIGEASGVACPSATACFAVGSFYDSATQSYVPVARWNGTTWSTQPASNVGGSLTAISCLSTTACTAVGYDSTQAFVQHWDGSTWSISPTPPVPGANPNVSPMLQAVACTSATACDAVGVKAEPEGGTVLPLLAERLW